ncbi:MAG: helix-turn-helix domain-containing protein, partial [bacterium]
VFPIAIPPLRERPEDIMPLTELFLKRFCSEIGKKAPAIPAESREWLLSQRWEGNVRELQNTIERAVILLKGNDLTADLLVKPSSQRSLLGPGAAAQSEAGFRIPATGFSLDEHEKTLLLQALERAKHNKTAAAKMLGLTRATLRYRLEKYNINAGRK